MTEPKESREGSASRSKSEEIITFSANAAGLTSPKARVASVDHRNLTSSPIRRFTIVRQAQDSKSYDIIGPDKLEDQNLEASLHQQTPIVKLNRISSPVKPSGLEPNEMALISASVTLPEVTTSDFDMIEQEIEAPEEISPQPSKKVSREMKNLQQSANSSKVLSNFLTNTDIPRRRKNKEQSLPPADIDSEIELTTIETDSYASLDLMDKLIPLKHSPISNNESDSTIVLQEEKVKRRRKSQSRPRSRSRSRGRGGRRTKSMAKMMNEELAAQSDREENDENIEDIDETIFALPHIFENRAPNAPPRPGWDSYCFKCHLDNAVLSLACKSCKCSYHRACVRPNPIPKKVEDFICPECLELQEKEASDINKFGHPKIDQHTMKEMLLTILETIRTQTGRDFFENDIPFKLNKDANPLIVTQMSYKTIEERIMNFYYTTTEAFIRDMKQLEHNWTVVDKSKAKALKPVMKYIIGDINEMESCIHCYSSAFVVASWFSAACKRPHLLVWAKLKGYPYWPAKVMSVDVDRQVADVRFFGAHDRAYIPSQHCLIFCEKDPNKVGKAGAPPNNKKGIGEALKETEDYIQNVRAIYGFEYSNAREVLDSRNFQAQLEKQLPKLKNSTQQAATEKEADAPQKLKEKLTLKFIRTSDNNKNAENASKVTEKERHPLYRVLSKADSTETEVPQKMTKFPSRRNTHDSERSSKSAKKSRLTERLLSETSESNLSSFSHKSLASNKKGARATGKRKKTLKDKTPEPEPKRFCPPAPEDTEEQLLEEIPAPKAAKRQRNRSRSTHTDMPLVVSVNSSKIPAGTDEIHMLRESPVASGTPRVKNRSRSLHRSSSQDKEKGARKSRRSSAHPTTSTKIIETEEPFRPEVSILRRRLSQTSSRKSSPQGNAEAPLQFPAIEIKSEPTSDIEEIVETNQVTVSDIPGLVIDNGNKRKMIIISTSENSNDSNQASRARKSFPNSISSRPNSREGSQARMQNPMICIPQALGLVPVSNAGPKSAGPQIVNVNGHSSAPASRRTSTASILEMPAAPAALPRLVPKPAGVFTQDGSNFQMETGAVSALFSENAHRMTDYFKSLLVDTIGAVSSGIPAAENTLLRLENEKLKLHAQKTKNEHNLLMERMKKEHMDEIRVLRVAYDEKLKKFEENARQDLLKAKIEIRNLCEIEKQQAIEALKKDYKKTTWCSCCLKEARYYCCWNTSYCGPVCQREHWPNHQGSCRNTNTNTNSTITPVAVRENPTTKRTTAPSVQIAANFVTSVSSNSSATSTAFSNATLVIPMMRKPSISAVQSISAPITTPAQYEIRAVPQQAQNKQIQSSQIALSANVVQQLLQQSNLNLFQQQQIRQTTINPPALVPTGQAKKVTQLEKPKQTKVVHKVVTTQPNLIVIPRPNSPPINIISTPSANNSTVQNLISANSITTVTPQTSTVAKP